MLLPLVCLRAVLRCHLRVLALQAPLQVRLRCRLCALVAGCAALSRTLPRMVAAAVRSSAARRRRADRLPPPARLQVPTRYGDREGGYCRVKAEVQRRRGDNTEMATIELV